MRQNFSFNVVHWNLISSVISIASLYVPSLNALQLVEQKLIRFQVSTCERFFTYENIEESKLGISTLNQVLFTVELSSFGTHEEELESILLTTIFSKKSKICSIPSAVGCVCFCSVSLICCFLTWWQNWHSGNPQQPMGMYVNHSNSYYYYVCK